MPGMEDHLREQDFPVADVQPLPELVAHLFKVRYFVVAELLV